MKTHAKPMPHRSQQGFTLVELMIAVGIIGILTAIAFPNYTEYVRRAKRTQAQTALQDAAQFMQRFYAANNSYKTSVAGTPVVLPGSMTVIPAGSSGTKTDYNVDFVPNSLTNTGYTLRAVPANSMASDKCGTLTLTQTGARGQKEGMTVSDCWK